jgi:uncharacterized membrane protein YukC
MTPSKLKNSISAADEHDQLFDEIMSMSEDASLTGSPPSPSQKGQAPIPANRIALVRHIEEEQLENRRRQNLREFGYKAIVVISVVIFVALIAIFVWLMYLAMSSAQHQQSLLARNKRAGMHDTYGMTDVHGHQIYNIDGHQVVVVPRKMASERPIRPVHRKIIPHNLD